MARLSFTRRDCSGSVEVPLVPTLPTAMVDIAGVHLGFAIVLLHSGAAHTGGKSRAELGQKGPIVRSKFHRGVCASALLSAMTGMLVCGIVSSTAGASTKKPVLRILVTNDDGVQAPGIDETVKVLKALPDTSVTVVAPLSNQSGTGAKVTSGALTATASTTASGYPAKAVAGYPADTIIWAIDDHGVTQRPNLVVSGINFGQNIGPLSTLSGTVGAAETAVARGIPALAVSQGVDNGQAPDFAQGAKYLVAWVQAHRHALLSVKGKAAARINGNLNVPTCATGHIRGPATVRVASSLSGFSISTVNCSGSASKPTTDVQAFVEGFASISGLHPVNPAP